MLDYISVTMAYLRQRSARDITEIGSTISRDRSGEKGESESSQRREIIWSGPGGCAECDYRASPTTASND